MNSWYPAPRTIPVPLPFPLPGELFNTDIDARLATDDEDVIYARTGLIDHRDPRHKAAAWRAAHGTHVLDLAAGYDPAGRPEPPDHRGAVAHPGGRPDHGRAARFYVGWRSLCPRPAGAAGNERAAGGDQHQFRLHRRAARRHRAAGKLPGRGDRAGADPRPGSSCRRATPICRAATPSSTSSAEPRSPSTGSCSRTTRPTASVEVWLPDSGGNRMSMTVVLPDGTPYQTTDTLGPRVRPHRRRREPLRPPAVRAPRPAVAVPPGDRADRAPAAGLRPAGARRPVDAHVRRGPGAAGPAHAWVQRDDSLYGYPQRGRQSYFDHAAYVRFERRSGFARSKTTKIRPRRRRPPGDAQEPAECHRHRARA